MKHFQQIGRIRDKYLDVHIYHTDADGTIDKWGASKLKYRMNFDVNKTADMAQFQREFDALNYLMSCQYGFSVMKYDLHKPHIDDLHAWFLRHIADLMHIYNTDDAGIKNHRESLIRKEYKAARHYLFQLSLPAFYKKLPDVVQTLETRRKGSL
jgi:hypothetical protein